ncbi:MAG: DUF2249 domain-containing protein [Myxococcales bacterium]|nr:DUF2249 domain-containing protein [Myxococcales bacterium]
MTATLIDARELLPPEPMHRVLEALPRLSGADVLTLLLYREPFPLYAVLEERGFTWKTSLADDGTYSIEVRRR